MDGPTAPAQALLRGAFDAVPDAVLVADDEGLIVCANAQCRSVFGLDPDQLVGRHVDSLVPARFRGTHPQRRAGYQRTPDRRPMGLLRLAAVRGDGHEFPAEISLAPIRAEGRTFTAATVRDITSRLREEELFRGLLDAAPDATVIVDARGRIVLANRQVEQVLGYPQAELVGRPVEVLVPSRFRAAHPQHRDGYAHSPASRPMGGSVELYALHRDGHELPVEISLSPLETERGLLVSAAVRDITERRRMQAESERLREELIATVSHELRTPLTSIIGYAELLGDLAEHEVGFRARDLVERIERNAARELRLVDDLLTMAFLDDHRLRVARVPTDLAEVVDRVVDDHARRAEDAGIALGWSAEQVRPVAGDQFRLVQVVENLLTNALKFTEAGGRVDVAVRGEDGGAVVEVADTGVGVAPEDLPHLFDRLYRTPDAIAAHVPGAGLGLPIVQKIVEAHEGTVEIESEPGAGTVVRVRLPYATGG
ncbi:PAS domain S-box protein [Nocardioides ferulae]|uniref:PAS domain S-box protein n=1 Tax=Nocardioides ferulae TaxID=2340821 RepID=UPI000EAE5DD1|nr:PAS domain S-box protein [Nocardioides ferulae]